MDGVDRVSEAHSSRRPGAMRGESFFRMGIKLARADVPLYRGVELRSIEGFKPGAKASQLTRGELLDSLFDAFSGGHVKYIAFRLEP
jgi:hypothetical protein